MASLRWARGLTVGVVLSFALSAYAFSGNAQNGKRLFMTKGPDGKACMTCHPQGLTTGETFKGKDIPDLTERPLSDSKVRKRTLRFLQVQGMTLTDSDLEDLLTFTSALPSQGFGPVPPEWRRYVQQKTIR